MGTGSDKNISLGKPKEAYMWEGNNRYILRPACKSGQFEKPQQRIIEKFKGTDYKV